MKTSMGSEGPIDDDGFTLLELLVVIVVLGVLTTVTVLAVRGITDQGQENSCAVELTNLSKAEEHHYVLHGSYAAEADLVANAAIVDDSSMYDITVAADQTYTIAPAASSVCTQTLTGGGTPGGNAVTPPVGPDRSTYAISVASSSFGTFHGNPGSFQVGPPSEPAEVVVFGRAEGLLGWHDMLNNAQPGTQRVTFVNLDNASAASITNAISQARNNGPTTVAYYPSDDPSNTAAATITQAWTANPAPLDRSLVTLVTAPASGTTLTQLLTSIG